MQDPKQAVKNKIKEKIDAEKKKLLKKLLKSKVFWIIVGIILSIILLIALVLGDGHNYVSSLCKYPDPSHDYTKKALDLHALFDADVSVSYADFIKGLVYEDMAGFDLNADYGDGDIVQGFLVSTVINSTVVLARSDFSRDKSVISLNKDLIANIHYCNYKTGSGCSGKPGPASEQMIENLDEAFDNYKYFLYVPNLHFGEVTNNGNFVSLMSGLNFIPDRLNSGQLKSVIDKNSEKYESEEDILDSVKFWDASNYMNYKVYNHLDHVKTYEAPCGLAYYWPIGSNTPNENDLYDGDPVCHSVGGKFGTVDDIHTSGHSGIDIPCGRGNTVIAISSGEVVGMRNICTNDGCKSWNQCSGSVFCTGAGGDNPDYCYNFVKIKHDDGLYSNYVHLLDGENIFVKVGDKVVAGQRIGLVGSSGCSTGYHLHFEIRDKNDKPINPEDYVSPDTPRL